MIKQSTMKPGRCYVSLLCFAGIFAGIQLLPAFSSEPTDNIEKTELKEQQAKADESPAARQKIIHGGLQETATEGYATGATKWPFLHGEATQRLPREWRGRWEGGVQLEPQKSEQLKPGQKHTLLKGTVVDMVLDLDTERVGNDIFNLSVHRLAGDADAGGKGGGSPSAGGDPDIHYFRDANGRTTLMVKNGAQVIIHGNMTIGGGPSAGGSSNFGHGGIVGNGQATFIGKYFKTDENLDLKSANIKADRIDIGNTSVMTNGAPVKATGNAQTGFVLTQLSGQDIFLSPEQISPSHQDDQTVVILGEQGNVSTKIVHPTQGIYDVKSVSNLLDRDGRVVGSRRVTTRLTSLSDKRMMVQMTVDNFDAKPTLRSSFTSSGYLSRK